MFANFQKLHNTTRKPDEQSRRPAHLRMGDLDFTRKDLEEGRTIPLIIGTYLQVLRRGKESSTIGPHQ